MCFCCFLIKLFTLEATDHLKRVVVRLLGFCLDWNLYDQNYLSYTGLFCLQIFITFDQGVRQGGPFSISMSFKCLKTTEYKKCIIIY